MGKVINIWYDSEGDYLEIILEKKKVKIHKKTNKHPVGAAMQAWEIVMHLVGVEMQGVGVDLHPVGMTM